MSRLALLALVTIAAACGVLGAPSTPPGLFFPRHAISGPHQQALLEGRLVVQSPCIFIIKSNGSAVLPIWSSRFGGQLTQHGVDLIDPSGRVLAREGDSIRVTGGETVTEENARKFMGGAPLAECRASQYWLVFELERLTPDAGSP